VVLKEFWGKKKVKVTYLPPEKFFKKYEKVIPYFLRENGKDFPKKFKAREKWVKISIFGKPKPPVSYPHEHLPYLRIWRGKDGEIKEKGPFELKYGYFARPYTVGEMLPDYINWVKIVKEAIVVAEEGERKLSKRKDIEKVKLFYTIYKFL